MSQTVIDLYSQADPKPDMIIYDTVMGMTIANQLTDAGLPVNAQYLGKEANTLSSAVKLARINITS